MYLLLYKKHTQLQINSSQQANRTEHAHICMISHTHACTDKLVHLCTRMHAYLCRRHTHPRVNINIYTCLYYADKNEHDKVDVCIHVYTRVCVSARVRGEGWGEGRAFV